jgi:hypothetical protein
MADTGSKHPDYFATILRRWKDRRAVQLTITYAASGYAIIQFLAAALRNSPALDTVIGAAWAIYWLGLAVVVFAIPLVLTGTHRFRSGLIAGIVVTSLAAGMYLQMRIGPDGGRRGQVAQNDSTPATRQSSITGSGADGSNGQRTNSAGDDSGSRVPVAKDDPGNRQLPADDPQREVRTQETELPVVADNQTSRTDSGTTTTPQPSAYDRQLLLYGERDKLTLENRPGLVELFAGLAHPITVRFYTTSGNRARLNVTVQRGQSGQPLDLDTVGAENSMQIRIPTACGTLTYQLDVVRLLEAAEVTIAIDETRSRQEIVSAEQRGDCRVL